MRVSHVKVFILAAGAAQLARAHTTFTNFFVNGVDEGDGTAVRMSNNIPQATYPISSVTSPDMACGECALDLVFLPIPYALCQHVNVDDTSIPTL